MVSYLETGLMFGRLSERTMHLCIDMQNVFAKSKPRHTPWMNRVLPPVERSRLPQCRSNRFHAVRTVS
jgi:nicotinamidase-related amidase